MCSKLNSLQNVYLGVFLLLELMECRHFIIYLSNEPRIYTVNRKTPNVSVIIILHKTRPILVKFGVNFVNKFNTM